MTRVNIAAAFVGGTVLLCPFSAISVDEVENPAAVELDPDYAAGKRAIEAKQWSVAIAALSTLWMERTHDEESLRAAYEAERATFEARHGEAARVSAIFLRYHMRKRRLAG